MDRYGLRNALLAAGLPPESFQIEGVHEHAPAPTDFWLLRGGPTGGWEIGPYERGRFELRASYAAEPAACAGFYQALTGRPTP